METIILVEADFDYFLCVNCGVLTARDVTEHQSPEGGFVWFCKDCSCHVWPDDGGVFDDPEQWFESP